MTDFFNNYFKKLDEANLYISQNEMILVSKMILKSNSLGGKVIIVGNGGSAAIASHASVDLTKAAEIRSVNFNESSIITCFANDYGYEKWVSKAIEFYAEIEDIVILISSSVNSLNIINGAKQCKEMQIPIITFSGFSKNNPLKELGDVNFWVDSDQYNTIEIVHQTWILSIVDYIINQKS